MKFERAKTSSQSPLIAYILEKRKERKFQQTAELSFTMIFICFFLFFAIRPTVLTISNLIGEIKAKKEMTKNLKGQINTIIQAQSVFGDIQANYDLINSCLPERQAFFQASNQLKGIANQASLSVNDISFGLTMDSDEKIPYYSYSYLSPINFSSLNPYIEGFLNNRRLIKIDSFVIDLFQDPNVKTPALVNTNKISLKIGAKIFYLPNKI